MKEQSGTGKVTIPEFNAHQAETGESDYRFSLVSREPIFAKAQLLSLMWRKGVSVNESCSTDSCRNDFVWISFINRVRVAESNVLPAEIEFTY